MFLKAQSKKINFKVATIFDIVVPALDNYTKKLLIMYSNPEEEYPIAITAGKEISEDKDTFTPDYTCDKTDIDCYCEKDISANIFYIKNTFYGHNLIFCIKLWS